MDSHYLNSLTIVSLRVDDMKISNTINVLSSWEFECALEGRISFETSLKSRIGSGDVRSIVKGSEGKGTLNWVN